METTTNVSQTPPYTPAAATGKELQTTSSAPEMRSLSVFSRTSSSSNMAAQVRGSRSASLLSADKRSAHTVVREGLQNERDRMKDIRNKTIPTQEAKAAIEQKCKQKPNEAVTSQPTQALPQPAQTTTTPSEEQPSVENKVKVTPANQVRRREFEAKKGEMQDIQRTNASIRAADRAIAIKLATPANSNATKVVPSSEKPLSQSQSKNMGDQQLVIRAQDLSQMTAKDVAYKVLLPLFGISENKAPLAAEHACDILDESLRLFPKNQEKIEVALPLFEAEINKRENKAELFNHVAREFAFLSMRPNMDRVFSSEPIYRTKEEADEDLSLLQKAELCERLLSIFGFYEGYVKFNDRQPFTTMLKLVNACDKNRTQIAEAITLACDALDVVVIPALKGRIFKNHSSEMSKEIAGQIEKICCTHFYKNIALLDTDDRTQEILSILRLPEVGLFAEQMFILYPEESQRMAVIEKYHRKDLKKEKRNTILRENCLAVKLGTFYINQVGKDELDKIANLALQYARSKGYLAFFHELFNRTLPKEFRVLMSIRKKTVAESFPDIAYEQVGCMFLFDFLCPYFVTFRQNVVPVENRESFTEAMKKLKLTFDLVEYEDRLETHPLKENMSIGVLKEIAKKYKSFLDRNTKIEDR